MKNGGFRFNDRLALVTGAGSGIGQSTVIRLLSEGASVIGVDISTTGLEKTSELAAAIRASERFTPVNADVSSEQSIKKNITGAFERLDVLINAAGILQAEHTQKTSLEMWEKVISVNLTGVFLVTRECLPALTSSDHSVVVNLSSTAVSQAHPYMAAYAASKGGIIGFTRALAAEYAKDGLRAVSLQPAGIDTPLNRNFQIPDGGDERLFSKLSPAIGNGPPSPETVSSVIAMLASEEGRYITGCEIRIDGGAGM